MKHERVSDSAVRWWADGTRSGDNRDMAAELLALRELADAVRPHLADGPRKDLWCSVCGGALAAYDRAFPKPVPEPPADPTPAQRALMIHNELQLGSHSRLIAQQIREAEAAAVAAERRRAGR